MDDLVVFKKCQKFAFTWIIHKAYFPLQQPTEFDEFFEEAEFTPNEFLIKKLCSSELYQKACCSLFTSPDDLANSQSSWQGHEDILKELLKRGIQCIDCNGLEVFPITLQRESPFSGVSHIALVECIMSLHCSRLAPPSHVMSTLRSLNCVTPTSSFTSTDALDKWAEEISKQISLEIIQKNQTNGKLVMCLTDVEELNSFVRSLSVACQLLMVLHHYNPSLVSWDFIESMVLGTCPSAGHRSPYACLSTICRDLKKKSISNGGAGDTSYDRLIFVEPEQLNSPIGQQQVKHFSDQLVVLQAEIFHCLVGRGMQTISNMLFKSSVPLSPILQLGVSGSPREGFTLHGSVSGQSSVRQSKTAQSPTAIDKSENDIHNSQQDLFEAESQLAELNLSNSTSEEYVTPDEEFPDMSPSEKFVKFKPVHQIITTNDSAVSGWQNRRLLSSQSTQNQSLSTIESSKNIDQFSDENTLPLSGMSLKEQFKLSKRKKQEERSSQLDSKKSFDNNDNSNKTSWAKSSVRRRTSASNWSSKDDNGTNSTTDDQTSLVKIDEQKQMDIHRALQERRAELERAKERRQQSESNSNSKTLASSGFPQPQTASLGEFNNSISRMNADLQDLQLEIKQLTIEQELITHKLRENRNFNSTVDAAMSHDSSNSTAELPRALWSERSILVDITSKASENKSEYANISETIKCGLNREGVVDCIEEFEDEDEDMSELEITDNHNANLSSTSKDTVQSFFVKFDPEDESSVVSEVDSHHIDAKKTIGNYHPQSNLISINCAENDNKKQLTTLVPNNFIDFFECGEISNDLEKKRLQLIERQKSRQLKQREEIRKLRDEQRRNQLEAQKEFQAQRDQKQVEENIKRQRIFESYIEKKNQENEPTFGSPFQRSTLQTSRSTKNLATPSLSNFNSSGKFTHSYGTHPNKDSKTHSNKDTYSSRHLLKSCTSRDGDLENSSVEMRRHHLRSSIRPISMLDLNQSASPSSSRRGLGTTPNYHSKSTSVNTPSTVNADFINSSVQFENHAKHKTSSRRKNSDSLDSSSALITCQFNSSQSMQGLNDAAKVKTNTVNANGNGYNKESSPCAAIVKPRALSTTGQISSDFLGPKLYVQPKLKSNRSVIYNAISQCCLAGTVNKPVKESVLEDLDKCETIMHFMILFRDFRCQYRAVYSFEAETETLNLLCGNGPRRITHGMVEIFFKYNSGSKQFLKISSTKHLSTVVDGISIFSHFWKSNMR